MTESPDIVYGRLLESAHISGYGFERMTDELEWLLEEERWKKVGQGYDDVNVFLRSIDLSAFNLGEKKRLHQRIKELQPDASNRAIGKATGTPEPTVRRHLKSGASNDAPETIDGTRDQEQQKPSASNDAPKPTPFQRSPEDVAKAARSATKRQQKDAEREQKREQNEALVNDTIPLEPDPDERYPTIVLDPPWDWDDEGDHEQLGRARPTYDTMSLDEIKAMPIDRQVDDNAHIYLWITNRSLYKGFTLLEAWGFRYITTLTWCKPHFGMGNYFRGQTEHVLFGVRGSLPLLRRDRGTWFMADRNGDHSAKPAEFYQLVEECSPGPWLEVFARGDRPGWVQWGAEVP